MFAQRRKRSAHHPRWTLSASHQPGRTSAVHQCVLGQMSVVGPRPEMPFIVAQYNDEQRQRLLVKPGITGLWQISPHRGCPIHDHLEYDFFYLRNRSLMLDAVILLQTVLFAARGV
jgi:lipopolysaccharide/colanic/teichoic acid biosynthesis glycosyltransferase